MKRFTLAVFFTSLATSSTATLANVYFGSANLSAPTLLAQANTEAVNFDTNEDQSSTVSALPGLILQPTGSALVSAETQSETASILATDSEFVNASFANAGSATIEFFGNTFVQSLIDNGSAYASGGINSFLYGFHVDSASLFSLSYNFIGGASSDYNGSVLLIEESGPNLIDVKSYSNSSGVYSANLIAGHSYDLIISNFSSVANDLVTASGVGTAAGGYDNLYTLNISSITTSVPEPGSWALMIAGIGISGRMMRRHRKFSAAFA